MSKEKDAQVEKIKQLVENSKGTVVFVTVEGSSDSGISHVFGDLNLAVMGLAHSIKHEPVGDLLRNALKREGLEIVELTTGGDKADSFAKRFDEIVKFFTPEKVQELRGYVKDVMNVVHEEMSNATDRGDGSDLEVDENYFARVTLTKPELTETLRLHIERIEKITREGTVVTVQGNVIEQHFLVNFVLPNARIILNADNFFLLATQCDYLASIS